MAVIGKAQIDIGANTSGVGRDIEDGLGPAAERAGAKAGKTIGDKIKDGVNKAGKEIAGNPPTVTPKMDDGPLKGAIDKVKGWIADLGKQKANPNADLDDFNFKRKLADAKANLARLSKEKASAKVDLEIKEALAKLKLLQKEIAKTKRDAAKPTGFGTVPKMPAIPGGIMLKGIATLGPGLIQAVTGYVGQALSLIASIGPAIAASAVVGASAMVAVLSEIKLVGLAFKAPTRAALSFKESMTNMKTALGTTIGRNMFGPLNNALDTMTKNTLPAINRQLKIVGSSFGHVAVHFSDMLAGMSGSGVLGAVVEQNAHLFRKLGFAFTDVISGVLLLIRYARPLTQAFGDWIQKVAAAGAMAIQTGADTGKLRDWFIKAGKTAAILGDILINTFQGLAGFFHALQPEGDSLLQTIDNVTKKFAGLQHSVKGQSAIAKWFGNLKPITDAFNRLFGAIGKGFSSIVKSDGGGFVAIIDAITGAVGPLINIWVQFSQVTTPIIALVVRSLGGVLSAVSGLMGVFGPITTGVIGFIVAMKGISIIIGLIRSLRLALLGLTATNPILLAIAVGVGLVVAAFSIFHKSNDQAKQDAADLKSNEDELTATLNKQTGALTQTSKAWVVQHLQQKGAYDDARALGVSTADVTQAAMGNEAAQRRVNAAVAASVPTSKDATGALVYQGRAQAEAGTQSRALSGDQQKLVESGKNLTANVNGTSTAVKGSQAALRERNQLMREGKGASSGYATSSSQIKKNMVEMGVPIANVTQKIRGQIDAIQDLNNLTLGRINANIAYQQQLDATRKELNKGTKTLDVNTKAGQDNKLSLVALITSAGAVTGSAKHQAEVLKEARDRVVKYAEACGWSKPKAELLADGMIKGTQASEANKKANEHLAAHLMNVLIPDTKTLISTYSGIPGAVTTLAGFKKTQAQQDADDLATFIKKRVPGVSETVAQFKKDQAEQDAKNLKEYINNQTAGIVSRTVSVKAISSAASEVKTGLGLLGIGANAQGGWITGPGTGTSDSILSWLSNKEFVVNAASAKKYGALLEAINANRLPGYASGGPVNITGGFDGQSARAPIPGMVASVNAATLAAAQALQKKMIAALVPQYKVGAGVAQWAGMVGQVLAKLGQSQSLTSAVLQRMNQESGGNPNVVNKWDSNWTAGHPSVGLMQVIGGTFASYAGPYRSTGPFQYGVSTNPSANTYAGLNYAQHRYSSILAAMTKSGGYADGGIVRGPAGTDNVLTRTTAGEFIVNAADTAKNRELLEVINGGGRRGHRTETRTPGGGDTININTNVYNPNAEKMSDSVNRRLTRTAQLGLLATRHKG